MMSVCAAEKLDGPPDGKPHEDGRRCAKEVTVWCLQRKGGRKLSFPALFFGARSGANQVKELQ